MQWKDLRLGPESKDLRLFAGVWLIFFGGIGIWQAVWREQPTLGWALVGVGVLAGAVGLAKPEAIRWLYVAAAVAAFPIGWLVSKIILALLFYGLFTPMSFIFHLLGRDALRLKRDSAAATYWSDKPQAADPRQYFRQY